MRQYLEIYAFANFWEWIWGTPKSLHFNKWGDWKLLPKFHNPLEKESLPHFNVVYGSVHGIGEEHVCVFGRERGMYFMDVYWCTRAYVEFCEVVYFTKAECSLNDGAWFGIEKLLGCFLALLYDSMPCSYAQMYINSHSLLGGCMLSRPMGVQATFFWWNFIIRAIRRGSRSIPAYSFWDILLANWSYPLMKEDKSQRRMFPLIFISISSVGTMYIFARIP